MAKFSQLYVEMVTSSQSTKISQCILGDLKDNGVKLMTASRTWAPEIAQEILKIFKVKYAGVVTR
ncbi:ANM_collapsed_G0016140.mRNA.1.CDS.1 [Saccharomyces cerevisiae]|nr:ANM_collapsed_G0016140.mRNA.1.CDS.1 [Saccharomyces cerevisiae]